MRKTTYFACVVALSMMVGPRWRSLAAPRCYPTERFRSADDPMVRDTLTKLVWQRQSSTNSMTWTQARDYCSNAGLRLPTVKELRSISDFTLLPPGPIINQKWFPNTPAERFWTSSLCASSDSYAWFVSFDDGTSDWSYVNDKYWVRCVR
jgi:hypothetical protein